MIQQSYMLLRRPSGKAFACQCRRRRFDPCVRKIPERRKWQPTPVFSPGEFHGQRSPADCGPWGCKESDTTEHSCVQYTPAIPHLGVYSDTTITRKGLRNPMSIAALFTVTKTWNQPTCPSDEWMKTWYMYTMECYSATEKSEITAFAATWI